METAHEAAADLPIAHLLTAFPELFAHEFPADADPLHDLWHSGPAEAPLHFDVTDVPG